MTRLGILALIFFAICVVLGVISILVYRSLIKKTGDSDPSSVFLKIINKILFVAFIICIFMFFVWFLPLIVNMKSFFLN